ncbi:MAG: serine protease [Rhodomicrobium sp.]
MNCRLKLPLLFLCITGLALPLSEARSQERIVIGKRIVGGERTDIKDHPWQVALYVKTEDGTELCGGSIIAPRWVLTAAHCFGKKRSQDARAKSGVNDYVAEGRWIEAEKVFVHSGYDDATYVNDIALIKLQIDPKGQTIPLVDAKTPIQPGLPLEVTGWGVTESGQPSKELRKANVPYVENAICNEPQAYNGKIKPGMMCAGSREGGVDSCQGDSGGPLVLRGPDGPVLVGVVSWGEGCAEKLRYGVYTRVTAYRDWITKTILANQN